MYFSVSRRNPADFWPVIGLIKYIRFSKKTKAEQEMRIKDWWDI
jgi:hypothetical protein